MHNHLTIVVVLRDFIKHQDRSIAELVIDNLELGRVVEGIANASKCLEDLGHGKRFGKIEGIFILDLLSRQTGLHMVRGEEWVERVNGVPGVVAR